MTVIFESFEQIKIDGQSAGNIVDVLSNHGPLRADVLAAFGVFTTNWLAALDAEKSKLVEDHKTTLASANATIADLHAKIAYLESIKSFDDSLIAIDAFISRVQPEMIWLMAQAQIDEKANDIIKMLLAKKGTKETPLALPVNLKSPNLLGALGYLVGIGKLTPERFAEITLPATREEAYDAN